MRVLTSLLIAASLAGTAMAQTVFPNDAKLSELLKARIEDGRATGLVLGVLEADGTTRIVASGDPGAGARPLGPDSVFEIGSVTKVFTTTLLADMVRRGEVTLDAPAQQYAPPGMVLPTRNGKHITLTHLAEQNSGLPRLPTNFAPANAANPYADYTVENLNAFLASHQLARDPGASFEYSNLGMGVLGAILAHRAGMTYEQLVHTRILTPLGMTMTSITLTPTMEASLAHGHGADGSPAAMWDLPTLAGAGALRSTMTDMLKFLDANVGEPKTDLERAMRDAQKPRFPLPPTSQIGLGWISFPTSTGNMIAFHDGGTGGYGAIIGVDQTRSVGLVILANRTGVPEDIALHLIDPAISLSKPPEKRTETGVPADVLASHVGVYALDSMKSFKLTVTLENGQLHMQATGQDKFPIFPESPTKFFLKVVDAQVTFAGDHLILHQGGVNQRATREG
jgi:D-alanyl-D-alanine-carboxypeptidase/D-alanyl-D-alanine-endopeptidase